MSQLDPGGAPGSEARPDISRVLPMLERLGARLEPATLVPPRSDLLPILLAEAAAGHADTFPSRRDEYGPDTQLKWEAANAVSPGAVASARRELSRWREEAAAVSGAELYLSPTLAGQVPALDCLGARRPRGMVGHTGRSASSAGRQSRSAGCRSPDARR